MAVEGGIGENFSRKVKGRFKFCTQTRYVCPFVVKFKLLVDFYGSPKKLSLSLSYCLATQSLFIVGHDL